MPNNELDYMHGVDVTLTLSAANVAAASAGTALTLPQGGTGLVVPAGYEAHAILLSASSNVDLTAGTATFRITNNGTINTKGPTVVLSDLVQRGAGVAYVGAAPVAAGRVIGVSVVTNADYAPVTADLDVVLLVKILPAG